MLGLLLGIASMAMPPELLLTRDDIPAINIVAEFSATDLCNAIAASYSNIHDIDVAYVVGYRAGVALPGAYVRRHIRIKSPHFIYYDMGHGYPGMPWTDDLFRKRCIVNGDVVVIEYVNNRYFVRRISEPNQMPSDEINADLYLLSAGIWPEMIWETPKVVERPHLLRDIAASASHNLVRAHVDIIDGRTCHVLMDGSRDHLWFDMSRGACLMKREVFDSDGKHLMVRTIMSDHREVKPGLWLPMHIRHWNFGERLSPTQGSWNSATTESVIVVESLNVNANINDREFRYVTPPGAIEGSLRGDSLARQVEPGGVDHLDFLARWLRKYGKREFND